MNKETIGAIEQMLSEFPSMCADGPARADEIDAASQRLDVRFPSDYREFLERYGGGMVGPYPIFGLRPVSLMGHARWSLVEITETIRAQLPNASRWVIFSEDHAGNPIGFDDSGRVYIFDHDFGGESEIASDFENYIRVQCLHLKDEVE